MLLQLYELSDILHVQQTPKPEAQLPALTPPLFEHSSLEEI